MIRVGVVVSFAAVALMGCGSDSDGDGDDDGGGGGGGTTIAMEATEFAFEPAAIEAAADTEFTIELSNSGTIEHDLAISDHEDEIIAAAPGKSASGSFTLAAGSYEFYCSVAGHKEAGMTGTLTVE